MWIDLGLQRLQFRLAAQLLLVFQIRQLQLRRKQPCQLLHKFQIHPHCMAAFFDHDRHAAHRMLILQKGRRHDDLVFECLSQFLREI